MEEAGVLHFRGRPDSPAARFNIVFWHGLRCECAGLLSNYVKVTIDEIDIW